MTDSKLQSDGSKQFVQLFAVHGRSILSYILTLTANQDAAEEIFQETSLTLWEKFADFEPGTNFRAWACQIAYYKVLNFRHRQQKTPLPFSQQVLDLIDQESLAMSDSLDRQHRALADCYAKLGPRERELVDQRYRRGTKTADIAQLLGRSRISVYRTLAKVHQRLLDCVTLALQE